MKCPLCRNEPSLALYRGVKDFEHGMTGRSDFDRCGSCGLIFQNPLPSAERLKASYPADYTAYSSEGFISRLKDFQASMLLHSLARELPPGRDARILELGCGGGHLLRQLKARGFRNLSARDWNDALAPVFESLGIDFHAGDIDEQDLAGTFDCVILNNVIEHLRDPERVLARLQSRLAPGGRILVRTPNSDSLSHRIFSRRWAGLHAPRHVQIFNRRSLESLASKLGFPRVDTRVLFDPSAWALSFQNVLRDGPDDARTVPSGPPWPALISLPLWVPAALIEHGLGRSSSLVAVLRLA